MLIRVSSMLSMRRAWRGRRPRRRAGTSRGSSSPRRARRRRPGCAGPAACSRPCRRSLESRVAVCAASAHARDRCRRSSRRTTIRASSRSAPRPSGSPIIASALVESPGRARGGARRPRSARVVVRIAGSTASWRRRRDRGAREEEAAGGAVQVEAGRVLRVDGVVDRDGELVELLRDRARHGGVQRVEYASIRPFSWPPVSPPRWSGVAG